MSFLIVMTIGLIGLMLMALPGLQRHGHAGAGHAGTGHAGTGPSTSPTHGGLRLGHGTHGPARLAPRAPAPSTHATHTVAGAKVNAQAGKNVDGLGVFHLIPSPRAIFSVMAMFGAFSYALVEGLQLAPLSAGLLALIPACGIEYFAVRPLWNLMFRFQGRPSSSLATLLFCEATAVTPFRNGRGLVSVEHDGRIVQLSARLAEAQASTPVRVGDLLLVEEVIVAEQRVVVSVP